MNIEVKYRIVTSTFLTTYSNPSLRTYSDSSLRTYSGAYLKEYPIYILQFQIVGTIEWVEILSESSAEALMDIYKEIKEGLRNIIGYVRRDKMPDEEVLWESDLPNERVQ